MSNEKQPETYQPYHTPRSGQNTGNNDLESHRPAEAFIPCGWPTYPGSEWDEKSQPKGRG